MNENVNILKSIADETRKNILTWLRKLGDSAGEEVKMGAYGSPSSRLDLLAEKSIIDFITKNDLPYNIFTEESGFIDRNYEKSVIVDPIDGSYNAENGIPFYSISLAIGKSSLNDVEVAFVKNVPMNIDYWAVKGGGAFKNNKKLRVRGDKNLYILYLGKKSSMKAYQMARKIRRVRSMGCASLEMIMVAEGIADLFYYSFSGGGALRIVDIAGSSLIVREAGGVVLDENLNDLNMGLDFSERKNVIAASNLHVAEVMR